MIRRCDGTDPFLEGPGGQPCHCTAVFDDVEWMVLYPHQRVHGVDTWWSVHHDLVSPYEEGGR